MVNNIVTHREHKMQKSRNSFYQNDAWKEYEQRIEEKRKSIKRGPNVIHLEYLGDSFKIEDINEFGIKAEEVGLVFSHYDKNGDMYANLDQFELVSYLVISAPIITEFLKGIGTNMAWDAIKYILFEGIKKLRTKHYHRATQNKVVEKKISFGLKVNLDRNTSFNFELNGDLDDTTIQNSLDKILTFIGKQKINEHYKLTDYVHFDKTSDEWVKIDVTEEIEKMSEEGKLNEK